MKPAPFEWHPAATVEEAVEILAADDDAKVLAGGQSLVPLLSLRLARPSTLVDLGRVGLCEVETAAGPDGTAELVIGAMVRQRRLESDPVVAGAVPLLAEAAAQVGFASTRTRGTLGGSLAHADPVAELPAVAVALGATLVAVGPNGTRTLPATELADGYFTTTLDPAEILVSVRFAVAGDRHGAAWREWSPRRHDFPEAGVGVAVELDTSGKVDRVAAAACGIGGRPLDLGAVLADAGLAGASSATPALLHAISAAVKAAAAGGDRGRDELCGLLAADAAASALARAAARRAG